MQQLKSLLGIAVLALFITACNGPTINIAAPLSGFFEQPPEQFRITYSAKPVAATLALNGFPVQQYFDFGPDTATASGELLQDFLLQGKNTFQVNPPLGPKTTFNYDSRGPVVVIKQVNKDNPSAYTVSGILRDPAGIDSLLVNNTAATLNGDQFSVVVSPNANYEFVAVDGLNKTSTTVYTEPGRHFNRAIKARIGQNALDNVAPVIVQQIQDLFISGEALEDFNPLLDGKVNLLGLAELDANLTEVAFGSLNINTLDISTNNDGKLLIDIDIYDLHTAIDAYYDGLFINLDIPLTVDSPHTNASGEVTLGIGNDGKLDLNLDLDIAINDVSIDFVNIGGVLEAIGQPMVNAIANAILPAFKGLIGDIINQKLKKVLDEELGTLVVEGGISIGDAGLGLTASLDDIGTIGGLNQDTGNVEGNIVVALGGSVVADPIDPGTLPVLGSVLTAGELPDPEVHTGNITALVSGNFINQAVTSAYQAGFTHITLADDFLAFGSNPSEPQAQTRSRIRVLPSSPASFTFSGVHTAVALLEMHEFNVVMESQDSGEADGYRDTFVLTLDVRVPILLSINEDNAIEISLQTDPVIDILAIDDAFGLNLDAEAIDNLVDQVVPILLTQVGRSLLTIEVPTISGITLQPDEIATVGDNNEHLSFTGTLLAAP